MSILNGLPKPKEGETQYLLAFPVSMNKWAYISGAGELTAEVLHEAYKVISHLATVKYESTPTTIETEKLRKEVQELDDLATLRERKARVEARLAKLNTEN